MADLLNEAGEHRTGQVLAIEATDIAAGTPSADTTIVTRFA
jgi:hypothetical protein